MYTPAFHLKNTNFTLYFALFLLIHHHFSQLQIISFLLHSECFSTTPARHDCHFHGFFGLFYGEK